MQINELAKWRLEIHTWVLDQNLYQDPRCKSIKGNSLWNIQGYASTGTSGPCNSFCLGIPMWQSKWISMTILFLKRLWAAHFLLMNFNKDLTKGPLKLTAPPLPLDLQVFVSLLCMNVATVNVHISHNHFISSPWAILVKAWERKHLRAPSSSVQVSRRIMMMVINLLVCCVWTLYCSL